MKHALFITLLALAIGAGRSRAVTPDTNGYTITLAEGFQQILAHHEELLRLRKDVERAAGTKLIFHARDLPFASVQALAGIEGGKLYVNTRPYALVTAEFSAPLFNTGMAANWKRGELEVMATEQNLNVAIGNRLHEFRLYYLRAQRLQQIIAIYEEVDRRLQANITAEEQRRNVGSEGPRPVLQARVQLLAERADLTAFRREYFDVRSAMAEMMGSSQGRLPAPAGPLTKDAITVDVKAQTELAEQRRADLKFLKTLIQMAEEDKQVVQAGYFPYISAIGSGLYIPGKRPVYAATPIIEGQQPLGRDARGGVSMTWQIVDNGQVTGAARQVEGVKQEYEIILGQLEENIPRELERISHSLENADAKLKALEKSTDEADEDLQLIEQRIALGEATQLDFSDAQRNLLAVRHAVVDALFDHAQAQAELDRATGRYLEFAEPVRQP